ncbi:MAG: hypothetical protein ACO1OB_07525 [Archangium sp.]
MPTLHDIQRTTAGGADDARGVAFLGVATFLKPSYRIAVTPRTGELAVRVQPVAVKSEPLQETRSTRH